MGGTNDGHLRMINSDMTEMREAFGGELKGGQPSTNSYLKARYVQTTEFTQPDGQTVQNYQMVAIATSRDRTLQAGKLFLLNLNGSEANSTAVDLTPFVPGDRTASQVGRYYDAEVVGNPADQKFLVSWSDGPVESETLALGKSNAQFGIYLFDSKHANDRNGGRSPIWDDPTYWDILARPVQSGRSRRSPPRPPRCRAWTPPSARSTSTIRLSSRSRRAASPRCGSSKGFRARRGASTCSAPPSSTASLSTARFPSRRTIRSPPPCRPTSLSTSSSSTSLRWRSLRTQKAGGETNVANESIWISGRPGEHRFCGGCHESRTEVKTREPGLTLAGVHGPVNLVQPRAQRISTTAYTLTGGNLANPAALRGVPWDKAIQPILDAKCVSCHGPDQHSRRRIVHGHRHDHHDDADVQVRSLGDEAQRHGGRADDR